MPVFLFGRLVDAGAQISSLYISLMMARRGDDLLSLFCCGLSLLGRPLPLLPQRTRCRHLIPALRLCLRALVPWRGCLAVS